MATHVQFVIKHCIYVFHCCCSTDSSHANNNTLVHRQFIQLDVFSHDRNSCLRIIHLLVVVPPLLQTCLHLTLLTFDICIDTWVKLQIELHVINIHVHVYAVLAGYSEEWGSIQFETKWPNDRSVVQTSVHLLWLAQMTISICYPCALIEVASQRCKCISSNSTVRLQSKKQ